MNQSIRSKSNPGACLDAYGNGNGSPVHVWSCDATNANQKWQYNDVTGQIMHGSKLGLCLDGYGAGDTHLWACSKTNDNQKWTLNLK